MAENQLVSDEVPVKKCSYAGFWIRAGAAVIDFIILIFLDGLIKKLFFYHKKRHNTIFGLVKKAATIDYS